MNRSISRFMCPLGFALSLLVFVAAAPVVAQTPSVDDILARHAQALGGEALAEAKTLKITGNFNFNGIDSPYVVHRQRPNLYRLEINTSRGTVIDGFDGETAWSQSPDRSGAIQVRTLEDKSLQDFLDENVDFDSPLIDSAKKGHQVELVGEADIDGVATYHLKLTMKSGSVQQWYLSKDDGLAVRRIATAVHRRTGPYDRIWYLMEHETTDGVTLPFYTEREDRQHVRAYTIDKVEVGVEIDPGLFARPSSP